MIIPQELFYQFALHLPSTKDVLTFALTHSYVRKTLLTPALFKERLALRWDMSAWKDARDDNIAAQSPPRYLERWMRIDYIYCRTVQLFDEAAVGNYFSKSPSVDGSTQGPVPKQPDPESQDDIVPLHSPDQDPVPRKPLLDEQKAIVWLRKLSEVLPAVLTHQRGGDILKITESKYHSVLLAYARVLSSICGVLNPKRMFARVSGPQALMPRLPTSEYVWLERICFCLVALLIQYLISLHLFFDSLGHTALGNTDTVTSIFSDTVAYSFSPSSTFRSFWATVDVQGYSADSDPYTLTVAITEARQFRVSDRYLSSFLIQGMIFMTMGSDTSLSLCPPSIPYINPAVSFSYDELFEPQQATSPSSLFLPPPRPWLQNRLAGTPLAELLSSAGSESGDSDGHRVGRHLWAGYYTIGDDQTGQDPPMFLELHYVRDPLALPLNTGSDHSETIHFCGEGYDGVGAFTLRGSCDTRTGAVTAKKFYVTHEWNWLGMVTPFGMAGIWGDFFLTRGGWWWIWPREWSNNRAMTEVD